MKRLLLAIALLMGISFSASAQHSNAKVLVLINKASWCPVCQANGPRVMKNVLSKMMMDKNYSFVMNDLSDNKTIDSSKAMLEKAGIYDFAQKNKATGMIYFFDARMKKPVDRISMAASNKDIEQAFKSVLAKCGKGS